MTGRILIVDPVVTTRIVLKVKLAAAFYDVNQASSQAEALLVAANDRPDLILCDHSLPDGSAAKMKAIFARDPGTATIPVVALMNEDDLPLRARALSDGADDLITRPYKELKLLARIRSLLRVRTVAEDLRLRADTSEALGFAEAPPTFQHPVRICLVGTTRVEAVQWKDALAPHLKHKLLVTAQEDVLANARQTEDTGFDGYIIAAGGSDAGRGLNLMSELRSRAETRRAAVLIVCDKGDTQFSAAALDMGAGDAMGIGFEPIEVSLRMANLLMRKAKDDQLNQSVQDGLEAAITDQLTGLYNRRYALPHLHRMAQSSRVTGHEFAVMLLDLDHFKRVNDTHGHAIGDIVLSEFAERIRSNLRSIDLVARIGGEEFLIAMPETNMQQAKQAARRLCQLTTQNTFANNRIPGGISISMSAGLVMAGKSLAASETHIDGLLERADTALYQAKDDGRNTVKVSRSAA